jgi:hypothetical protein
MPGAETKPWVLPREQAWAVGIRSLRLFPHVPSSRDASTGRLPHGAVGLLRAQTLDATEDITFKSITTSLLMRQQDRSE